MTTNTPILSLDPERKSAASRKPEKNVSRSPAPTTITHRSELLRHGVTSLWLFLALAIFTGAGVRSACGQDYAVMEFTPEELREIQADHLAALPLRVPAEAAVLPKAVNLLPYLPYTPSTRSQGGCGNCWAWAGTGVMEIAHAVEKGVRDPLSIQFINSCNTSKTCCRGGWLKDVVNFYKGQGFAIPVSNPGANWQSGGGSCNAAPCELIERTPCYPINAVSLSKITTHSVSQATAIANIKTALSQNKAVWFGFFLPSFTPFRSFWANEPETTVWNSFPAEATTSGHAVLCVGYDDSDPNNRYWIMLNSWGVKPGRPHGLFRVAMDINYDVKGDGMSLLYWQTLEIDFTGPVYSPQIAVSAGSANIQNGQTAAIDFGTMAVGGTPLSRTFTLRNTGDALLLVQSATMPAGFRLSEQLNTSLEPGEETTFNVSFVGTASPTQGGQLIIQSNDRDTNPFKFPVIGRVSQPLRIVWVDSNTSCGSPNGTGACPYRTINDGYGQVATCGTVRVVAGRYSLEHPLLTKCATIEPYGGSVLITGPGLPRGDGNQERLELSTPDPQPNGTVMMRFPSIAGQNYQIYSSTDLRTWELWQSVTATANEILIADEQAATTPQRFFKLVIP